MPLPGPGYLRAANIQDDSVRFEWDDWRTIPATETPDQALFERLDWVSQRAVTAFMCGTAEWVVHRFAKLLDDQAPHDFLEAAWAMTVHVRYCRYGECLSWETYRDDTDSWKGPVKKPVSDALLRLEVAIQRLAWEATDPVGRASLLAALATYVLTDPAPYKTWCGQVLDRFEAVYRFDPDDPLGDVVPRQALDPAYDFKVEQTEALINEFLASLDHRSNRFLASPEAMLDDEGKDEVEINEEGGPFPGRPYVFDIEEDRRARRTRKIEEEDKGEDEDEGDEG
jgi:hypothetical protein